MVPGTLAIMHACCRCCPEPTAQQREESGGEQWVQQEMPMARASPSCWPHSPACFVLLGRTGPCTRSKRRKRLWPRKPSTGASFVCVQLESLRTMQPFPRRGLNPPLCPLVRARGMELVGGGRCSLAGDPGRQNPPWSRLSTHGRGGCRSAWLLWRFVPCQVCKQSMCLVSAQTSRCQVRTYSADSMHTCPMRLLGHRAHTCQLPPSQGGGLSQAPQSREKPRACLGSTAVCWRDLQQLGCVLRPPPLTEQAAGAQKGKSILGVQGLGLVQGVLRGRRLQHSWTVRNGSVTFTANICIWSFFTTIFQWPRRLTCMVLEEEPLVQVWLQSTRCTDTAQLVGEPVMQSGGQIQTTFAALDGSMGSQKHILEAELGPKYSTWQL